MRRPQANPNPVLRKAVEPVRRHAIFLSYGRRKEGQEEFPSPPHLTAPDFELLLRGFGPIRRAAALAFARVLAFAAVVAGLAAAFALAVVLALPSVLFLHLLVALFVLVLAVILRAQISLPQRL